MATEDLTITVLAPAVVVFNATPVAIVRGQTATLAWTVEGATLEMIEPGVGAQTAERCRALRTRKHDVLTAGGVGGVRQAQETVVNTSGRRRAVRH